jgi:hypothetical protein
MRLTDKIAATPPSILSIGFLVVFIGGGVIVNFFPLGSAAWTVAYSLTMIVLITPILAWHYSIYRAASDRSLVFVGHRGRPRLFVWAVRDRSSDFSHHFSHWPRF